MLLLLIYKGQPMINDVEYTNRENSIEFSVSVTEGSAVLHYNWTVNNTMINTTKDGTIEYNMFPNGITKVQVRVWNTNYNGDIYSDTQTIIIEKTCK